MQLIIDLLLSEKGIINTLSPLNGQENLPQNGYGQDGQPSIYWCNPDITWATKHPIPRVAQGSFRAALQGLWKAQTGLNNIPNEFMVGKPTRATYLYGESALNNYHQQINGKDAPKIDVVYMVGDSPASDIQGANAFVSPRGHQWKSILVESGVHNKGETPAFKPDYIVADVSEAVFLTIVAANIEN
jgi:ribonucleotide monophosphatase NagD (HAD superfamily)